VPAKYIARVKEWAEGSEFDKMSKAWKEFSESDSFRHIEPFGFFTTKDCIRLIEDTFKRGKNPRVVFIDLFSQLNDVPPDQPGVIQKKIDYMGDAARDFNIHISLIAQLRRLGKDRANLDIREMIKGSGGYEERSDLVFQVERLHYYKPDVYENTSMDIHCLKQRDGDMFSETLGWTPETVTLFDPKEEEKQKALQDTEMFSSVLGNFRK
jgi:hypothetical protein